MKDFLLQVTRLSVISYLFFGGTVIYLGTRSTPTSAFNSSQLPVQTSVKTNSPAKPPSTTPLTTSPTTVTVSDQDTQLTPVTSNPILTPTPIPTTTKMSQLMRHSDPGDCWIAYRGHVYDITTYFGAHPGGDTMLAKYCGLDATSAFDSKDQNPPNPHSAAAMGLLESFLIE